MSTNGNVNVTSTDCNKSPVALPTTLNLLVRVKRLGPINTRPTYIIRFFFVDIPTPIIVKKLTAFKVGNGVDVNIAADLYLLCNDEWHARIRRYVPFSFHLASNA
jgi:hypothetical protein